jgi:hypothetical protein
LTLDPGRGRRAGGSSLIWAIDADGRVGWGEAAAIAGVAARGAAAAVGAAGALLRFSAASKKARWASAREPLTGWIDGVGEPEIGGRATANPCELRNQPTLVKTWLAKA